MKMTSGRDKIDCVLGRCVHVCVLAILALIPLSTAIPSGLVGLRLLFFVFGSLVLGATIGFIVSSGIISSVLSEKE